MIFPIVPGVLVIAATLAIAAAAEPFPATCAYRSVCADYRSREPKQEELYTAKFVDNANGQLNFNLTNGNGNNLIMTIRGVVNDRFQVSIEEPDRHRFSIPHGYSLEKTPTYVNLTIDANKETSLSASDSAGNTIEVSYEPVKIEFFRKGVLESTFDGSRLIMDNTEASQAFTFELQFNTAKRLLGLFEHPTSASLVHTANNTLEPYRLKNIDHGSFGMNETQSLYGSIPVIYGFGNVTSGLFVHNAAEMWVDIDTNEKSAYFMVNGGVLDFFILLGPTLPETIRQYTGLTGKPHLPQLWALGYHQCRWAYNNTEDVKDIIGKFDEYDLPLDVLWLDIEYTANREWFTWNYTSFPDPVDMLNWVDAQAHRKMVPISDPHMKVEPTYKVYADCLKNDYFINNADGTPMVSICWPGNASWIDFLNPAARDYYADLHLYENFPSTSTLGGFWNDMNEPATFDDDNEKSITYESVHYGNVKHRDVHNMYGLLQVTATHQGLMKRDEEKLRPFLLSRSYFSGSQRYTAKWNGDTWSNFDYLRILVPMTVSANLAGLVFYGGDVPGFFGKPSDEIASKWYQTGAWIPFYRAHGDLSTERREPWVFSPETQGYIREAIKTRYYHLPYWYRLFYEHTISGDPLIRPFYYHYPDDEVALDINDEFLVGKDVLVANVYFSEATSLRVYLPGKNDYWFQVTGNYVVYQGGEWYNVPVNVSFTPVFYKSGSIIIRKPRAGRSSYEIRDDPHEVHIVLDDDGKAETTGYLDDFESFDYLNKKKYFYFNLSFDYKTQQLSLESIDDSDHSSFTFDVETVFIYTKTNSTLGYQKQKIVKTRHGVPLTDINLKETHMLL